MITKGFLLTGVVLHVWRKGDHKLRQHHSPILKRIIQVSNPLSSTALVWYIGGRNPGRKLKRRAWEWIKMVTEPLGYKGERHRDYWETH